MNIAMLLSGGVDSSVALALLKNAGHKVTAFYLKIWLEDELSFFGDCPWEQDLAYARSVCEKLDIELKIVPLQTEYKERVIAYTIAEIKAGRTPNPDMMCNPLIKCGAFYETIGDTFDKIATGHYADLVEKDGFFYLKQTPDAIKDQTYFLARLSQEQLSRMIFPLGKLTKQEVRALAETYDLPTKARKDSQGLCFLGKITFKDFIKCHVGTQVGELVEYETGNVLGTHEGFWFYTHGQRQGLGLAGGPWYVVKKDPALNIVYISNTYHGEDKMRDTFYVSNMLWVNGPVVGKLWVKLRHGPQMHSAMVTAMGTSGTFLVTLDQRDQGIAPGQFAVFYDENKICIGSGSMNEYSLDEGCI